MSETIVRVQDHEGRGPFRPGFTLKWSEDRPDLDNLIPWPLEFGLEIRNRALYGMKMGCGCRTVDQLRRWFTESEYRTLLGFGYHAVEMEVGTVLAESHLQLIFSRSKPLNVDVVPFELYKNSGQTEGKG